VTSSRSLEVVLGVFIVRTIGSKKMIKPILYRYHVNKVPVFIRPQLYIYGYRLAILLFIYLLILRFTTKLKIIGHENLIKNSNHIFFLWHSFVPFGLTCATPLIPRVFDCAPQAWMQHPVWYMKPIHVLLRFLGIKKIILGSTGHSGRDAADLLVDFLRCGYSTVINPDGPNGPPFILKKGILYLSLKSNVTIVPLQFSSSSYREIRTWDRKKFARPFSTLEMKIGKPIFVTSDNFEQIHELLAEIMG